MVEQETAQPASEVEKTEETLDKNELVNSLEKSTGVKRVKDDIVVQDEEVSVTILLEYVKGRTIVDLTTLGFSIDGGYIKLGDEYQIELNADIDDIKEYIFKEKSPEDELFDGNWDFNYIEETHRGYEISMDNAAFVGCMVEELHSNGYNIDEIKPYDEETGFSVYVSKQ